MQCAYVIHGATWLHEPTWGDRELEIPPKLPSTIILVYVVEWPAIHAAHGGRLLPTQPLFVRQRPFTCCAHVFINIINSIASIHAHSLIMTTHNVKLLVNDFANQIFDLTGDWDTQPQLLADVLADTRFQFLVGEVCNEDNISKRLGLLESIKARILELVTILDSPTLDRDTDNLSRKRKLEDPVDDPEKKPRTRSFAPPEEEDVSTTVSVKCAPWDSFFLVEGREEPAKSDLLVSYRIYATVEGCRVRFNYVDHNVHIISYSAVSLQDDLEFFVACMIAYHRLPRASRVPNGIIPFLSRDSILTVLYRVYMDFGFTFHDAVLTLTGRDGQPIPLRLGQTMKHDTKQFGPSTVVVHATSPVWPGRWLVVKFVWRSESSLSKEEEFVMKARAMAGQMGNEGKWVLDHLPEVLHSQVLSIGEEEMWKKLEKFFRLGGEYTTLIRSDDYWCIKPGRVRYYRRSLQVLVSDLLFPLDAIGNTHDLAQVFVDAVQCHKWLYDHPRILHRDISPGNIMYRFNSQGEIVGVLNDFGNSLYRDELEDGYKLPSACLGMGTIPSMAIDQLSRTGWQFYRHELEAFYYTLLNIVSLFELTESRPSPAPLPTSVFFPTTPTYVSILKKRDHQPSMDMWLVRDKGQAKRAFLKQRKEYTAEEISPSMECFKPLLKKLFELFRAGLRVSDQHVDAMEWVGEFGLTGYEPADWGIRRKAREARLKSGEWETLKGTVSYETFMQPVLELRDRLGGLRVRDL